MRSIYDTIGMRYSEYRRPDARIATAIFAKIGKRQSIVNLGAYWRRPHAYLEEGIRSAISTFSRITHVNAGVLRLQKDLESGLWHQRYGHILNQKSMDFGYRIVVSKTQSS